MIDEIKERIRQALESSRQGGSAPRLRLSALHECPRFQVLQVIEPQEATYSLEQLGHFTKGIIHELWLYRAAFPEALHQFEVELEGIKGHIDLYYPPDCILELKATSSNSIPFLPNYQHVWQVKAYLAALKQMELSDEPQGYIVYFITDNPAITLDHIYPVFLSPEEETHLITLARQLREAVEARQVPDIPPHYVPHRPPCAGVAYGSYFVCPFHERCWGKREETQLDTTLAVPTIAIERVGWAIDAEQRLQQQQRDVLRLKEEIETRLRELLKSRDDIEEITIEGVNWQVVARKDKKPTVTFAPGAKEKMIEDFGEDFLKPYLKEERRVRVYWSRKGQ